MKRIFYISVLLTLCCLPMAAQLNGTGYYRFRNAQNTSDYISIANDMFNYKTVVDDACGGFTNAASSEGQNRALACAAKYLQTDIHMVNDADCIDPSTVVYAKKKNTNSNNYDYNLIGQGTSLLTLTTGNVYHPNGLFSPRITFQDRYISIQKIGGEGTGSLYTAMIELSGTLKSLGTSTQTLGKRYFVDNAGTFDISNASTADNAKWYIEPINHFNVYPNISYQGKFYTTLYVPFAFKLSGCVENAYAVNSIADDGTLSVEIVATNNETVPAGTPVLLECSSNSAIDCQLIPTEVPIFTEPQNVENTDAPSASTATNYNGTNLLKGNYYCNLDGVMEYPKSSGYGSFNANHFTAPTGAMYVLGLTASGKLGMVKATDVITGGNPNAMPANKAWIEYSGSAELVFPFTASTPGDVNRDGNVDALDIMAVINIIRGRDEGFNYDYDAADVNGDDDYTLMDINAIINIIRGR